MRLLHASLYDLRSEQLGDRIWKRQQKKESTLAPYPDMDIAGLERSLNQLMGIEIQQYMNQTIGNEITRKVTVRVITDQSCASDIEEIQAAIKDYQCATAAIVAGKVAADPQFAHQTDADQDALLKRKRDAMLTALRAYHEDNCVPPPPPPSPQGWDSVTA